MSGVKITELCAKEVRAALKNSVIEVEDGEWGSTEPYILYQGRRSLGRTDLCDDVATGLCANKTAEGWRKHYLRKATTGLGGRLVEYPDGRLSFLVIDSYTDG